LTAGYKNDQGTGYTPIAQMFQKHSVRFDFTALELLDSSQPSSCSCGPQELVTQTLQAAANTGITYSGENALTCYYTAGYQEIEYKVRHLKHDELYTHGS